MSALVEAARQYLKVPFHHQGRSTAGMDCGGLLVVAAKDLGITLKDIKGYARTPDGKTLKQALDSQLTRIKKADIQEGDILLMRIKTLPQHIAIKTDTGMIHAFQGAGKVTEHNMDERWAKRIVQAYRL